MQTIMRAVLCVLLLSAHNGTVFASNCIPIARKCFNPPPVEEPYLTKAPCNCAVNTDFPHSEIVKFNSDIIVSDNIANTRFTINIQDVGSQKNIGDSLYNVETLKPVGITFDGLNEFQQDNDYLGTIKIYVLPEPFDGRIRCPSKSAMPDGLCSAYLIKSDFRYGFPIPYKALIQWRQYVKAFDNLENEMIKQKE